MSDLDLTPIKARLNAATPGPWDHNTAAELIQTEKGDIVVVPTWFGEDLPRWDDAEFIANAPADIAALLAEVERLREQLADVDVPMPEPPCYVHDEGCWDIPGSEAEPCTCGESR